MGNGKSLERAGSGGTREVVQCRELVDAGGAHRIFAGDTWNLVQISSLSTPHHEHTLVTYTYINTCIQPYN